MFICSWFLSFQYYAGDAYGVCCVALCVSACHALGVYNIAYIISFRYCFVPRIVMYARDMCVVFVLSSLPSRVLYCAWQELHYSCTVILCLLSCISCVGM